MPTRLKNLRIDEVSTVDRGAGHGVNVVLMKREFSDDERQQAADRGQALPDGSFPIKSVEDLKNAIQAIGRAKDPAKAKAHIKARARALGRSDLLPDSWGKRDEAEKALHLAIDSILESDATDKADLLADCFKAFQDYEQQEGSMPLSKEDLAAVGKIAADAASDAVAKALEKAGIDLNKMTPDHAAYHQNLDGDEGKKFASMSHDERTKYMKEHPHAEQDDGEDNEPDNDPDDQNKEARKALAKVLGPEMADLVLKARKARKLGEGGLRTDDKDKAHKAELAKRDQENSDLKKRLGALEEDKQKAEFSKRAVALGLTEADGAQLLKAHRGDPEALKWMEDEIAKLHKQVDTGDLFKEYGAAGRGAGSAHDELVGKAAELRKADPKLTVEQAYAKALKDPANSELAKRESAERHARINKMAAA